MDNITYLQSLELIDIAIKENRVYHHNGGQAYIRMSMDSNVLMIIDHATMNRVDIELMDGTAYFKEYALARIEHSSRLQAHVEKHGTFLESYIKRIQLLELDLV